MLSARVAWVVSVLSLVAPFLVQGATDLSCLGCDRQMRKTFEAIQAWRRSHNGAFPDRLADLTPGFLPPNSAICPEVLREQHGASTMISGISSSADAADPPGTYQYEMSAKVQKWEADRLYLPPDTPHYTRQDVKSELLRRSFFEQVAILRCSSHRTAAPAQFADNESWRNFTVDGKVYWSGPYWEQVWLDFVPLCARDANVLFGLKGPPFHTDKSPSLDCALDLRNWSCAFGDHAWWWTFPMFGQGAIFQAAAHLRPLFQESHGRVLKLKGEQWWIDGLVQLQGKVRANQEFRYLAPSRETFAWQKTGLSVGRSFRKASWLQGTVWPAKPGETNGWLVWHYADDKIERVPIVYANNTARFWGDRSQIEGENDFLEPVWRYHEESIGKERWLRIYRQEWINPRPESTVTSLDFISNRESSAAPFLIAVNIYP